MSQLNSVVINHTVLAPRYESVIIDVDDCLEQVPVIRMLKRSLVAIVLKD